MAPRLALASALTATLVLACSCWPLSTLVPQATAVPPTLDPTQPPPAAPSPTHTPLPPTATATPEPSPTSPPAALERSFVSVQMFSFSTGWAVAGLEGEVQRILRTADSGSTWADVTPPEALRPTDPLLALAMGHFVDAGTAWVTYYDRYSVPDQVRFWRTADGGQTWEATAPVMPTVLGESYHPRLWFADDRAGWFLAEATTSGMGGHSESQVFRTADGGATWDERSLAGCGGYSMSFIDLNHGWITESCGGSMGPVPPAFWVTEDGGETFQQLTLPIPDEASSLYPPHDVCGTSSPWLFSATSGVVIATCRQPTREAHLGYLFLISNGWHGGSRWFRYPVGTLQFVTEETGWSLGLSLYRTQDGGRTWTLMSMVDWDGQFSFIDDHEGWAVDFGPDAPGWGIFRTGGILLHTTDGGQSWEELNPEILP